ncbi:hypothetical protein [Calothrix sp. 336/3]|uniref:hypothetical protein n=1 Tax=Calothrix sp. 336/3 TaxID=1337936 RepID=UPI000551AB50|nr:hypothetical protein [Calothrix sp. 336/3]AKG23971.1 hypothetical protein IJ00_24070 [Calothrix sp. 336/3]
MTQSNKAFKIIQIVPQLPPSVNGLGDYAINLALQLQKDYQMETIFIVGDRYWQGANEIEGFPIKKLENSTAEALLSSLVPKEKHSTLAPEAPVILHYVGYGYAQRGCPVWLVEGLELWKTQNINSHLVTMFHEVYASGKPWTSAFWLSSLQKTLASRLTVVSDRCFTSKELYAEILYKLSQGKQKKIPAIPVFSNIAEPKQVPALAKRQRHLVVFGGTSNRLQVYNNSSSVLSRTCKLLEIEKIIDIGPPVDLNFSYIDSIPIIKMGQQPAAKISETLLNSLVGFLNYNSDYLAKSGIFAAYCAHGLLPVSVQYSAFTIDGIEPGKHYWCLNAQSISLDNWEQLQAIADNAFAWYQTHNLSVHAKIFATYLEYLREKK